MKRILAIALTLMMVLGLSGCSSADAPASPAATGTSPEKQTSQEASSQKEGGQKSIGVLYCLLSAPAVKVFSEGINQKAKELGVDLIELDGGWDAQKQADQMNSLIAQKVDAIILNPVDSKSIIPAVKKAHEAGIPVIMGAMNIDASGAEYITSYVGADEKDVGRAAGQLMKSTLGADGGEVIIVEGKAGTDPQIFRTEGFEEAIEGSKVVVTAKVSGDFDKAKAMTVTQDALTKNPDIKGIWVHDDTMCVGVVQAIKSMGYTGEDIAVVSYNGSQAGYDMVKAGDIVGTAVQPVFEEGEKCVQVAQDAVDGKPVEAWYKDEITSLTKEQLDTYNTNLLW